MKNNSSFFPPLEQELLSSPSVFPAPESDLISLAVFFSNPVFARQRSAAVPAPPAQPLHCVGHIWW